MIVLGQVKIAQTVRECHKSGEEEELTGLEWPPLPEARQDSPALAQITTIMTLSLYSGSTMTDNKKDPNKKEGRIRQENIAAILTAAEDQFVLNGFRGTTIQAVADAAGLPKANVLYYFKTKSDLYGEVLANILNLWNSSFDQVTADDDPALALADYIRAKVELSRTHPKASRIYASEVIHGAPYLSKYLRQSHSDWARSRAPVIQAWVDQGRMDPIDPAHLLFLIWGATQHYADFGAQVTKVIGRKLTKKDYDGATESLIHIILKGCGLEPVSLPETS